VRVNGGVEIIDGLKVTLDQNLSAVEKVYTLVNEVSVASDEQSKGIEQINVAISQMNQATQSNAANAEEAAAASEETSGQAESLRGLVKELTQIVNGGNLKNTIPAATTNRYPSRSSKPVSKPVARKPENVIPFDDDMDKF
jgi:uncharacterized phage infection (PIP) family protein YhgE